MQPKTYILFLFCIFIQFCSYGQDKNEFTQSRILILLDESSSMIQPWAGGKEKIKIANELILKIMDSVYSVNGEVEFSLRVFGNQHTVPEHDCNDTKNEVAFSKYNKTQMEFRLEDLHPLGVTPIAYALSEAAEKDLVDEKHNAYSIILITDGGESCGGDICDVMLRLIKNKVYFRPYILNLEEDPEIKKEYSCMGDYLQVTKKSDIPIAVGTIVEAFRPMLKISKDDYKALQAINVPSVLKVKPPVIKSGKPKDTAAVETPKKKLVDTIAAQPKPEPKHTITAGEEIKRPEPLKMRRIQFGPPVKLYTGIAKTFKPHYLDADVPDIKMLVPEVLPVRPAPAKLVAIPFRGMRKLKITKPEPYTPEPLAIEVPDVKPMQPDVVAVRPAPLKMTAIPFKGMKKQKIIKEELNTPEPLTAAIPDIKMLQPEVVAVRPAPAKMTAIPLKGMKKLKITKFEPIVPEPLAISVPDVKILQPDVVAVRPAPVKMTAISLKGAKKMKINRQEPVIPEPLTVAIPAIKYLEPDVVKPPVERPAAFKLTRLKPTQFKMHLLYGGTFFDADLKPLKLSAPPQLKPLAVTTPNTNPVKPAPKTPPAKTGEYTVNHEDASETTLEVYLTNGKGKFYSTTPQVILTDPETNKELKKFYRFVDAAGNPDPITNLPAGIYDLSIVGRDDLLAHVDMQPGKKTKVYIKVKNFSLYFYYKNAPDRPVTEFKALVIQRNTENGKQIVQKCTERLEYEPGNYHIQISTFPEDVRNIDLDAESAGGIAIEQPGFLKITPEVKTNSVTLWQQSGERFLSFYTLELNNPNSHSDHLQIQPGHYQVQYSNGTTNLSSSNRVISFEIKSNQETEVKLVK